MSREPRPFFETLQRLLDQDGAVTLGSLAEAAGDQTYGLLVLLLALPSLLPAVNVVGAPVGGAAIFALGWQMIRGVPHPSLPEGLRRQPLHKGRLKAAFANLERHLDRFRWKGAGRRPLDRRWTGFVVAWTGILLAVPVPLPFGNILPAAALLLLGAALLEERPAWLWLGIAASTGITLYFGYSFRLIVHETHRILHWMATHFS
ncbi:MAG TPA: exopolysaccharide biosynthesis protein [Holophagaceae bacterium]|nr:exopolysaccharide biosynthesis protein [Holophagaceae bacterium]